MKKTPADLKFPFIKGRSGNHEIESENSNEEEVNNMEIKSKSVLKGIAPYTLGQTIEEMKEYYGLHTVRKMSDNENVYGTSLCVQAAIMQEMSKLSFYPDGTTGDLKKKLAAHYGLEDKGFIVSNGSEELIRLLTRAYINQGDEAIMAEMTFPRYQTNVLIEGGKPVFVPLINGVHDLQGMKKAITDRTKLIFVCNPNNPTGTIVDKNELLSFMEIVPSHVLIIVDEAYYEYVTSDDYLETIPLQNKFKNLVILRTFSKIYGLASMRIGYGIMAEEIIQELHKVRDVFNVNQLAQAAAIAALADQEFVQECAEKNLIERKFLSERLKEFEINSYPSESNFLFTFSNRPWIQHLKERGFLVREMKLPGYQEVCRMTLGTREDHEELLQILSQLFHERAV